METNTSRLLKGMVENVFIGVLRFPWLKEYNEHGFKTILLDRWRDQIERGGTRLDKLNQIFDATKIKFDQAKGNLAIVHDRNIRSMALDANKEIGLENFKASNHWIWCFKERCGLVSRVITNFITKRKHKAKEEIDKKASDFVIKIKKLIETNQITLNGVFNMDQSNFLKEQHSRRYSPYFVFRFSLLGLSITSELEKFLQRLVQKTPRHTVLRLCHRKICWVKYRGRY